MRLGITRLQEIKKSTQFDKLLIHGVQNQTITIVIQPALSPGEKRKEKKDRFISTEPPSVVHVDFKTPGTFENPNKDSIYIGPRSGLKDLIIRKNEGLGVPPPKQDPKSLCRSVNDRRAEPE